MKLIWFGRAAVIALCSATLPCIALSEEGRPSVGASDVVQSIDKSEREIARLATQVANSHRFFEEDYGWIEITARYDVATGVLSLDPGSRFGPISGFHEMEDLHSSVYEAVVAVADRMPHFKRIEWVYGGFDLYHWFPQDRRPQRAAPLASRTGRSGAPVLISAGHGYYFNHGYKDWRAQRDAHNGILEDGITINFADLLIGELFIGGVESVSARNAAFKFHEPSKQPYHMIAARYQLEELLPNRPDIWHSLPTATHALREYDEDIRSRPLYANYIGASELISIHTNADAPSARGTRVIVQKGDLESAKLGNMVLCYMKEHIHSIKEYADFNVATSVSEGDKGENRLAAMPSVIVEVGFHTNVDDATALKDLRFQGAAMRGVAKGYRLFKRGKDCSDFEVSAPKESHGGAGATVSFPIEFSGNPDFPVALTVVEKNCSGVACHDKTEAFYSEDEFLGYRHSFQCRTGDAYKPESVLIAKAHDYKGIESIEAVHTVRCDPPPPGAS